MFLAGEDYNGAVMPMILLMPTVLLIGLSNITGIQILTPQNMEQKVLNSIICGAMVDFILNLVMIPKMASSGAALATTLAELVVLVVQCAYLRGILKDILNTVSGVKIGVATLIGLAAGVAIKMLSELLQTGWSLEAQSFVMLAISACAFFGGYGITLLLLREEFVTEMVRSLWRKR